MANVVTASREQVDWAIGILDKMGDGENVDYETFFKVNAILTAVSVSAFDLAERVEQMEQRVVKFCIMSEHIDWLIDYLRCNAEEANEFAMEFLSLVYATGGMGWWPTDQSTNDSADVEVTEGGDD